MLFRMPLCRLADAEERLCPRVLKANNNCVKDTAIMPTDNMMMILNNAVCWVLSLLVKIVIAYIPIGNNNNNKYITSIALKSSGVRARKRNKTKALIKNRGHIGVIISMRGRRQFKVEKQF